MNHTNNFISNGIVLAFNCIPTSVDPNITRFWEQLSLEMAKNNFYLIVASTADLKSELIATIYHPYDLIDFHKKHFKDLPEDNMFLNKRIDVINSFMKFYKCDEDTASYSLKLAKIYYYQLIKAVSPCAILGWQSTDITTSIVRQYAALLEIPFWCGERGMLRDTLIFDLSDNYRTSELNRSLPLQLLFHQYQFSPDKYMQLKKYYTEHNPQGKYKSNPLITREQFRNKYNIPEEAKVIVLFMHGINGHFSCSKESHFTSIHEINPDNLNLSIKEICQYCENNGIYLIFQDHPSNKFQPERIKVTPGNYVKTVAENPHSLLHAGDYFLFTISTIQYESIFYEKSIGLLSRSLISEDHNAYCLFDYESINHFMTELLTAKDWSSRLDNLRRKICFIYDYLLIKTDDKNREKESARVARTLSSFKKPITIETMENINKFIEFWG